MPLVKPWPNPDQKFLFKGFCQLQQFLAKIAGLTGCALPGLCCLKRLDQAVIIPAQFGHGRILKILPEDALTVTGKPINNARLYLTHARRLDN
jgi:hypothetical protein